MGKVIQINNNQKQKQMEDLRIKTADELQTENQKGKSQLVEDVTPTEIGEFKVSPAFKLMRYEDKYFIGFMGAMMTEPTEDKQKQEKLLTMMSDEAWSLLLNVFTHMLKNRKLIDNLNNNDNE